MHLKMLQKRAENIEIKYRYSIKGNVEKLHESRHFGEICCFQSLGVFENSPKVFENGGFSKMLHLLVYEIDFINAIFHCDG